MLLRPPPAAQGAGAGGRARRAAPAAGFAAPSRSICLCRGMVVGEGNEGGGAGGRTCKHWADDELHLPRPAGGGAEGGARRRRRAPGHRAEHTGIRAPNYANHPGARGVCEQGRGGGCAGRAGAEQPPGNVHHPAGHRLHTLGHRRASQARGARSAAPGDGRGTGGRLPVVRAGSRRAQPGVPAGRAEGH